MRRERFWFGTALVAVPLVLLLLAVAPGDELAQGAPVEGHVSIHGHPMAGGYIIFVPEDWKTSSVVGVIDETGHYRVQPYWYGLDVRGDRRFRICLFPGRRPSPDGETIVSESARKARRGANAMEGGQSFASVLKSLPQQVSHPRFSPLEVWLNSGPAHIDITL